MRATEYIEEDWNFVSLFGLDALDVFDAGSMWTNIQIIRSARGGGKTSILRIFSPKSLVGIHASRNDPNMKRLYNKLKDLGALSERGPQILGVYLSLFGNYSILEQLEIDSPKQRKLFSSLLMCRVVMATLRSVCELKSLDFPHSLDRIDIKHHGEPNVPNFVSFPCTGEELYEWAKRTEQKISDIIDDESNNYAGLGMHENLASLHVIKAENIFYGGKSIAEKTLLTLDDLDRLTSSQRVFLSRTLACLRIPIGLWMAERLEGLRGEELLSPDGTAGRECNNPIMLERFWRDQPNKFENLLADISDKRTRLHSEYNIQSFSGNLQDNLEADYDDKFKNASDKISQSILDRFDLEQKYKMWIDRCKNSLSSPPQSAEEWKLLEMAIERDRNKRQQKLFEDEPLDTDELDANITSGMKNIARYYIRTQYAIPYYFGFRNLVKLSSSNVEQFLRLAGSLFDDMISASYTRLSVRISPIRQEEILQEDAFDKWEEIKQSIPNSQHVVPFLENVAHFCIKKTRTPRSSYDGVTGIAITQENLIKMRSNDFRKSDEKYQILYDVLATCIAHNLLEVHPKIKQGPRGTTRFVMYLNRLLCLKFKLSLNYGGWQKIDLDPLCSFVSKKDSHTVLDKTQQLVDVGENWS